MVTVRLADAGDVPDIAALSSAQRARMERWAPQWWRRAAGADDLHPLWLGHLDSAEGPVARVAIGDEGDVRAAAITHAQGPVWFVDDVAAIDDDAGEAVLEAVTERPALTCVPSADADGARRARAAGWARVSSYWIGPPAKSSSTRPLHDGLTGAAPPHTFGAALAGGWAGGLPAPPIFDPGGPVTIVGALSGPDRAAALRAVRADAARRGDVIVALVVGSADTELAAIAKAAGLARTVDVWSAPPV